MIRHTVVSALVKILTCNIRYSGADDGENGWEHRKDLCARVIAAEDADVLCFQEMRTDQFCDLSGALPGYATHFMGDGPRESHPQNSIFYRCEVFEEVAAGGYWLSPTPHVPGSSAWDSACVRVAIWVRLRHRASGTELRVINTHLDHVSQEARENQARLIVEDALAYPDDYSQLLAGDMNCETGNPAIDVFKAGGWLDTYGDVHGTEDPGPTHHGFLGAAYAGSQGKIDWIFTRGALRPTRAEIVTASEAGRYPSDHYFLSATVRL